MAKSQETKEKFMELRARGQSYDRISKEIDVSKPTLIKWSRKYEAQISVLQDGELDAMLKRFKLTREARVERFANLLDRMEKQLEDRDLSDIELSQLVRLYLRSMELVRLEVDPLEVTLTVEKSPLDRWAELVEKVGIVANPVSGMGGFTKTLP